MTIGEQIKKRRIEIGMSQEELALQMGYKSKSIIDKIELGANDVGRGKISQLAQILNVDTAYLMGNNDNLLLDSRNLFAANLRSLLAKCGKSRQTVCREIGVSYSTFSDWYSGQKYPRIDKIELLANYFGVSVSALVGEDPQTKSNGASFGNLTADNIQSTIGNRIRNRRKALNISVDELADKIGKNRATVYRYERGDIENMPIGLLAPISQALDTSIDYLLGIDAPNPRIQGDKPPIDILDVIIRLHSDSDFRKMVGKISILDSDRLVTLQQFLMALGDK